MNTIRFVGDIHCKLLQYTEVLKGAKRSIQVGDFGVGMRDDEWDARANSWHMLQANQFGELHQFARGNHDDPFKCKEMFGYIPDGTMLDEGVFVIGGAQSHDRHKRARNFDWWPEEELSIRQFWYVAERYAQEKPRILVVHDFPDFACRQMFLKYVEANTSRHRFMMEELFEVHEPEFCIGGHWHASRNMVIGKTQFICLAELEFIDIPI